MNALKWVSFMSPTDNIIMLNRLADVGADNFFYRVFLLCLIKVDTSLTVFLVIDLVQYLYYRKYHKVCT